MYYFPSFFYPVLYRTALVIIVCLATSLTACIDSLLIEGDLDRELLVVDGFFSTASTTHSLRLFYTKDIGLRIQEPATGAHVIIFDKQGNSAAYREDDGGVYKLNAENFSGKTGEAYYLEITLSDGKKYRSNPQTIPERVRPVALSFQIESRAMESYFNVISESTFVDLFVDTPVRIAESPVSLRWRVDEVYSFADETCGGLDGTLNCYVYLQPKNDIVILNGEDLESGIIQNIPVFSKRLFPRTPEFEQKHVFNVYQHTITKEAYDYYKKARDIANPDGSIFNLPPAALSGNIFNVEDPEDLVLGFFEVASIDTIRLFLRPVDFLEKYEFVKYCNNVFPNRFTPDCCDCRQIEGSSLVAPDYW